MTAAILRLLCRLGSHDFWLCDGVSVCVKCGTEGAL